MSYQRFGKPGRFYIYMASEGLVIHPGIDGMASKIIIQHGPDGRDNAKAIIEGLTDFLTAEGIRIIQKKGRQVTFERIEP